MRLILSRIWPAGLLTVWLSATAVPCWPGYTAGILYKQDPQSFREVRSELCEQAVRDLEDHNAYWNSYEGTAAEVADKINDTYLRANAQDDGTRSYGRMVDLLLAWNRERGAENGTD